MYEWYHWIECNWVRIVRRRWFMIVTPKSKLQVDWKGASKNAKKYDTRSWLVTLARHCHFCNIQIRQLAARDTGSHNKTSTSFRQALKQTMRLLPILYGLLAFIIPMISATALTYRLTPNEKACFFTFVQEKGAKLAFYFAASLSLSHRLINDASNVESDVSAFVTLGSIRRFLRCRLQRGGPRWQDHYGRPKGTPGRFCVYGEGDGRVSILLR